MSGETLVEFLRARQSLAPVSSDLKNEWVDALDELLGLMSSWLIPAYSEGLLDLEISREAVSESELGTYDVPILRIRTRWLEICVRSIARVVLGGSGRVDVGSGPRRLVVMRCPDKSRWLISTADPSDEGQPLSEESFTQALQHLLELSGI